MLATVEYDNGVVRLIDQRRLPTEEVLIDCRDYRAVAEAIKTLAVRGAPAIGVTAALGLAMGARAIEAADFERFWAGLTEICAVMAETRPTAVNLFWAIERMKACAQAHRQLSIAELKTRLEREALDILAEDIANNRRMGSHGQSLIPDQARVLTHCNAGALATAGYGTALGVVRAAVEQGKRVQVIADETRPVLQGARLTAWELQKDGIPVTLIADNMAASLMRRGLIDLVIVGADRIAANGDVANKIGTYGVAVLAQAHGIPFYVAAPLSTIDASLSSGDEIPIEERRSDEMTHLGDRQIAPTGVTVLNPAFDVTPHAYVHAIITEVGVLRPPLAQSIAQALSVMAQPIPV
ncbi:MAG TPA: S-methyl-5-thioribose-1-phosphate isomerase [Candidatus Tectomicrobia bacterium]|jgi:methylthioribose-1-phosphate isomerase|nr:S-methyl-5-thioribose-1-phosphate isomerase [Candidatus Tectomicrobia bacterium]